MDVPTTVTGWRELRGVALIEAILCARWYPWFDDTIGGWSVMPYNAPPSSGVPCVASFLGEELAEHIAQLHNATISGGTQ
jgi:hypothetical protein